MSRREQAACEICGREVDADERYARGLRCVQISDEPDAWLDLCVEHTRGELLRWLLLARRFDERAFVLSAEG